MPELVRTAEIFSAAAWAICVGVGDPRAQLVGDVAEQELLEQLLLLVGERALLACELLRSASSRRDAIGTCAPPYAALITGTSPSTSSTASMPSEPSSAAASSSNSR